MADLTDSEKRAKRIDEIRAAVSVALPRDINGIAIDDPTTLAMTWALLMAEAAHHAGLTFADVREIVAAAQRRVGHR